MSAATFDFDSTLIRRAVKAATFNEMAEFAATLENRPLDKLLADLPGIAGLSEMKFSLARQVIRRRSRELSAIDREQLRAFAEEIAAGAPAVVAARIRELF
jgi:phosphoserine phosphatase